MIHEVSDMFQHTLLCVYVWGFVYTFSLAGGQMPSYSFSTIDLLSVNQLLPSEPWTNWYYSSNSYKHQLPCYFCTVIIIKAVYGRPSTFLYLCWLLALPITVVIKHILNKWFLFSIIFGKALSKHELVSTNYSNAFKFFNVSPRIHHHTDEQLLWMLYVCMYVCVHIVYYCVCIGQCKCVWW